MWFLVVCCTWCFLYEMCSLLERPGGARGGCREREMALPDLPAGRAVIAQLLATRGAPSLRQLGFSTNMDLLSFPTTLIKLNKA